MIGHPVSHSLSPVIHNAAFRALDIDWVFVALDVPPGAGAGTVSVVAHVGLAGLSVTMPHKEAAATAVDRLSTTAEALAAVNTVVRRGDELVGENTDGAGFIDALRADGFDPAGRRCLVMGAGGAGRAVVRALGGAGAAEVVVVNRSRERADVAAALAGPGGRVGVSAEAGEADLVVNATPLGMGNDASIALDPVHLGPGQLVVDLVYDPAITPLIDAARARGAAVANGLGMLIHQAAHAFRMWTGEDPPIEVMWAAALEELARHS